MTWLEAKTSAPPSTNAVNRFSQCVKASGGRAVISLTSTEVSIP